jgi:hypothetical protein
MLYCVCLSFRRLRFGSDAQKAMHTHPTCVSALPSANPLFLWRHPYVYSVNSRTDSRSGDSIERVSDRPCTTFTDNGERWASRAQAWIVRCGLGLRNADEHKANLKTQRLICLATCKRVIPRLYHSVASLPQHERHPFRDPMKYQLAKSVYSQERWVKITEVFLLATQRVKLH